MSRTIASHPAVRRLIYARDNGICHICGKSVAFDGMHLDHVIPRALGGEDHERNLKVSHRLCNLYKQDSIGILKPQRVRRVPMSPAQPRSMKIGGVEVLTIREAARRLELDRTTVFRQIQAGALRGDNESGTWLVTADEVARYARENKGKVGSPHKPKVGSDA